ncbi:Ig-like domain-containing protein [Anaeromyxobacter sp. Fw109-5]|uniref:Ig-like domain-containing protein n=1 Tax=Anaeromyxobacter sp. (strain Fw109-5) TaxID=404589 RepID=UPI0000ED6E14|nr:Ig-like domain-containing protein [Anaeromyxobacter sp. Fw109-5]ABS28157.1 hypothetical protein Anae109_3979 [Anaeromyxobacter sp. Fw109-5]
MARTSAVALVGFLSVVLQACSGGDGDQREELPPVVLAGSSPADGALGVATSAQVTLTFSGALAEASVSASSVSLRCTGTYTGEPYWDVSEALTFPTVVPVEVSYAAASRTITVAPRAPLAARRNCVLQTGGLRDGAGREVAASVSFRTVANPMTRRVSYDAAGAISLAQTFAHDAAGNVIQGVSSYQPGGDGEWLTADDPVGSVWTSAYDAAGNWTSWAAWEAGADLAWFTPDDPVSDFRGAVFDEVGRVLRSVGYGEAGLDGLPFTADDVPSSWSEIVRSAAGDVVAEKFHQYPGADGTWFTADDPTYAYDAFAYDAPGGRLMRLTTVSNPGADGKWLTPDDVPDYYYEFQYDAAGVHDTTIAMGAAGPDAVWLTDDDVPDSCQRVSYGANLRPTRFAWYRAGDDATCFTTDDYVYSYRELSYARNGGVESEIWYRAAGPDGEWFTADDAKGSATWFDPSLGPELAVGNL